MNGLAWGIIIGLGVLGIGGVYIFVLALCRAAAAGDRLVEEALRQRERMKDEGKEIRDE